MTTIADNTFLGANQGNNYLPGTSIRASEVNADMIQIRTDINTHLAAIQEIVSKLSTIEENATADLTGDELINSINASSDRINLARLGDVVTATNINTAIETHRTNTTTSLKHTASNIYGTSGTYSYTPTSMITSTERSLESELNNIRYQLRYIIGSTNWSDVPSVNITSVWNKIILAGYTKLQRNIYYSLYYDDMINFSSDTSLIVGASASTGVNYTIDPNWDVSEHGRVYVFMRGESATAGSTSIAWHNGSSWQYFTSLTDSNPSMMCICNYNNTTWRKI